MYFKRIYQRVWWKEWQWKGTFESGYLLPITFKEKKSSRMFGIAVMSFFLAQMIAGSSPVGIIFIFILFCVEESGHLLALRKLQIKESFIFSLSYYLLSESVLRKISTKEYGNQSLTKFYHFRTLKNKRNQVHRNTFLFYGSAHKVWVTFIEVNKGSSELWFVCIFFQNGYSFDSRLQWISSDYQGQNTVNL